MKRDKVLLIGGLNSKAKPLGGEEYKNRIIDNFLRRYFILKTIDTHGWKKNLEILLEIFVHIVFINYDFIIISASSYSSYRLIRILNFIPGKNKKTVYFVIGGYFPTGVLENKYKKKYYTGLKAIVVEGRKLKETLKLAGLQTNIHIVPNFKPLHDIKNQSHLDTDIIRFVFLSSISFSKGASIILDAVKLIHRRRPDKFCVDFWGPIDSLFKQEFHDGLYQLPNYCSYNGYLDILDNPSNAYSILADYDCMLFPTFFEGEGFPGAVIDAFIAGLPVIASDWNMNTEVISHGRNGLIVPSKDSLALAEAMEKIIDNPEMLNEMKINARNDALKYDSDSVLTNQFLKILVCD